MNCPFAICGGSDASLDRIGPNLLRLLLLVVTSLTASFAYAAPGDLDTTFSTDGKRTLSFFNESSRGHAVMVRPDGRIVIAGTCGPFLASYFCITQIGATGLIDDAFGSQGIGVQVVQIGDSDTVTAAALQPDGKIVVAGYCKVGTRYDFCLARLTAAGRPDSSFDDNGQLTTDVSPNGSDYAFAIAIQSDGKIVVAGRCGNFGQPSNFCVVRYESNGTLDDSFSSDGKASTDIVQDDTVNAVAIQADGKIIAAGTCADSSSIVDERFCIVRYRTIGLVDTGFPIMPARGGSNGDRSVVAAIVVQPDGRFVAVGYCDIGSSGNRACLSRYNTDGSTDLTFRSTPWPEANFTPSAAAFRPDGKIAVAGNKGAGMSNRFVIALYNSDGTLDQSFGLDGQAVADFANTGDAAKAIAVQSDGKFVLAGECNDGTGFFVMCIARFEAANKGYRECSLDLDGDGKVLATTDSLIHTRIALGITGNAVTGGITFPANATRNSWSEIRTFLVTQCGMAIAQ
jgi:uncharacterized delta-60 repeat protein